ncbi:uncharacterized protein LOC126416909 [Schistocerca serialis cubense]|uniref:uncharacterized protein LOC126416909 n=1 Tax=Schistocerca serialis cubense TaxID=2023355 RepID=UPI00214DF3A7|nr:uncharacterized protein LOC126416909 [Schistocerca serialis cubense]
MTGSQLPKPEAEQPETDKEIHSITDTGKEDATASTANDVQVSVPTTDCLTVLMAQLDMRDKQREQALINHVKDILAEEHLERERREQERDPQLLAKMNEMFEQRDKALVSYLTQEIDAVRQQVAELIDQIEDIPQKVSDIIKANDPNLGDKIRKFLDELEEEENESNIYDSTNEDESDKVEEDDIDSSPEL